MYSKLTKLSILMLSIVLLSGCADIAQIDEAKAAATAAMNRANEAYNLAQSGHTLASDAAYAAEQAQSAADAAAACCSNNSNKIDRMFEQTMRK